MCIMHSKQYVPQSFEALINNRCGGGDNTTFMVVFFYVDFVRNSTYCSVVTMEILF